MKETFALLVTAHLLSDFLFQTERMANSRRCWWMLVLHLFIVAIVNLVVLGTWYHPLVAFVVCLHIVLDPLFDNLLRWKLPTNRSWPFLTEQSIYLCALACLAFQFSNAAQNGFWFECLNTESNKAAFMKAIVLLASTVLCVQFGGCLVSRTVKPLISNISNSEESAAGDGVPHGGKLIGWLERSLVLMLMGVGQTEAVGFLVTAKSILRFREMGSASERHVSEYIIIGTFLSFGWAILVSILMTAALKVW